MMRRAAMRQNPPDSSPDCPLRGAAVGRRPGDGVVVVRPYPNKPLHRAVIFSVTWRRQAPPGLRQEEAEQEPGRAAAQVGRVVGSRGGEAEEDVDRRPADE